MDFFDALGLDPAEPGSPEGIAARLAGSQAPVVVTLVSVPDPALIAEKLLRLDRYCATGVRLALVAVDETRLAFEPVEGDSLAQGQRLAILRGLLLRAGLHDVEIDGFAITWRDAPEVPSLDTGGSARLTDHLGLLIASDPARAWRIEEAAEYLGLSGRSLQRYLLAEGGTFSEALRNARTDVSARLLRKSDLSLGEIGFTCGYADQAHFQREFRKVAGQTPRNFRKHGGKIHKPVKMAL